MNYSASRRPLAAHCLWPFRPEVVVPRDDVVSDASELGTAFHAVAAGEVPPGDPDADDLAELVDAWRSWWPGYSAGRLWLVEAPVAYDVATGRARVLPSTGQRDYSAIVASEVPGTIDAVAADEVIDLKTGEAPKSLAEYRAQVEHGAVCLSRMTGAREVRVTIAHVTADGVAVDATVLDAIDLAEAAETMRAELAAIPTATPQPGPWCRNLYCPAYAVCPETQSRLAAVPEARRLPLVGELESDEAAFELIDALPRFEAWVKDRKAAVKRRALSRGELVASDGRRYRITQASRETLRLDVDGAVEALRSVLGPAAEDAIVMKTSKEAVKKAARVAGLPLAPTERAVTEALRRIGAVKVSQSDEAELIEPALPAKSG